MGYCTNIEIGGGLIVSSISVNFLHRNFTYTTDSDTAQNSLQNDVLWAYGMHQYKVKLMLFLVYEKTGWFVAHVDGNWLSL